MHQDCQNNPEAIRAELQKIAQSAGFVKAERLNQFLRLVVEETLRGRGGQIKEYVVGTEVYGRSKDYDPRTDATVRVEAAKLRKRLSDYYAGEGRHDAIVICMPKGSYRPQFEHRMPGESARALLSLRLPPRKAMVGALLASLVAAGIWFAGSRQQGPHLSRQRLVSTFPGSHHGASFSPDGSMIAFIDSGAGPDGSATPQVWIKDCRTTIRSR